MIPVEIYLAVLISAVIWIALLARFKMNLWTAILSGVMVWVVLLTFCTVGDDATNVTVENRLSVPVDVYEGGYFVVEGLAPGEDFDWLVMEYDSPTPYEARAAEGTVLASVTLTWEQLRAQDFHIVFEN